MKPALVPELSVTDFLRSRAFYCEVLGFHCRHDRPEEGFAYLVLGAAHLMIDQIGLGRTFDEDHKPAAPPYGWGVNLQIKVDRIEPLLDALRAATWPLVLPPEDKWYRAGPDELGNRQFVVADPDGYLLRFFQDLGTRPAALRG